MATNAGVQEIMKLEFRFHKISWTEHARRFPSLSVIRRRATYVSVCMKPHLNDYTPVTPLKRVG